MTTAVRQRRLPRLLHSSLVLRQLLRLPHRQRRQHLRLLSARRNRPRRQRLRALGRRRLRLARVLLLHLRRLRLWQQLRRSSLARSLPPPLRPALGRRLRFSLAPLRRRLVRRLRRERHRRSLSELRIRARRLRLRLRREQRRRLLSAVVRRRHRPPLPSGRSLQTVEGWTPVEASALSRLRPGSGLSRRRQASELSQQPGSELSRRPADLGRLRPPSVERRLRLALRQQRRRRLARRHRHLAPLLGLRLSAPQLQRQEASVAARLRLSELVHQRVEGLEAVDSAPNLRLLPARLGSRQRQPRRSVRRPRRSERRRKQRLRLARQPQLSDRRLLQRAALARRRLLVAQQRRLSEGLRTLRLPVGSTWVVWRRLLADANQHASSGGQVASEGGAHAARLSARIYHELYGFALKGPSCLRFLSRPNLP